ncbi:MAG: hypothetical protein K2P80_02840 [Beijerinckiaceae bacterium]|nr:hypothetical protein [Beijerinckiaceae bacterium]
MLASHHSQPAGNGFVFFDLETTGLLRGFDQITQVAAIRTDADFNIVDTKRDILDLRCRRLPWIVPSPAALLVTGTTADRLERTNLSHYEMMAAVARTVADWAPAVFIGYNSLRFDEEHLRAALFSTLHDPYLTSKPGSGRADVLSMLQVVATLAPGAISLPVIDGKPSMKLGNVLRANGYVFTEEHAHDALYDVRGTIALMKLMSERAPNLVRHMLAMASRGAAEAFLAENAVFRHVTWYGAPEVTLATRIVTHPSNRSAVAIFDLAHDPAPYLDLDIDQLADALVAQPRVIRTIKLNAQPALLPRDIVPNVVPPSPDDPDDYTLQARATTIALASGFQARLAEAMERWSASFAPSPHVEQQLYDRFPSWADKRIAARFHEIGDWRERLRLAGTFEDARLREHALRLVYAECPNALPATLLDQMHDWTRDRLLCIDDGLPHLTIHSACEALESLKPELADPDTGIKRNLTAEEATRLERLAEIELYYLMLASGHQ